MRDWLLALAAALIATGLVVWTVYTLVWFFI